MEADKYIQQELSAGQRVHHHEGVWWIQTAPFFCRPVLPFIAVPREASRPLYRKSFLGYSHILPRSEDGNRLWSTLEIGEQKLQNYNVKHLSSSRERAIRQGLRQDVEVRRIEALDDLWFDLREICRTTALRTGYGHPARYYEDHEKEWRRGMLNWFVLRDREWWGAFRESRLIAYMYFYLIEDTLVLNTIKSHTEYLDKRPNDVLLSAVVQYARNLPACRRVCAGRWHPTVSSLNRWKESHGFERVDYPCYAHFHPAIALGLRTIIASGRIVDGSKTVDRAERTLSSRYRQLVQRAETRLGVRARTL